MTPNLKYLSVCFKKESWRNPQRFKFDKWKEKTLELKIVARLVSQSQFSKIEEMADSIKVVQKILQMKEKSFVKSAARIKTCKILHYQS